MRYEALTPENPNVMTTHTSLQLDTDAKINIFDITDKARCFVESLGCTDGALVVHINGSTASVSTIEYEPGLIKDITQALLKLFPPDADYHHHDQHFERVMT